MREKRILWIGSYQSKEQFESEIRKNIGQASGYAAQKGLIKGIDNWLNNTNAIMDTLSSEALTPYPKHPNIIIKKIRWHRHHNTNDISIGFINIKYLNYLTRTISLFFESSKWLHKNKKKKTYIFVYAPTIVRLIIAKHAKKKYGSKAFVLIPDIPELTNPSANKLIRFVKQRLKKSMKKLIQNMDGLILYSEHMADYYELRKDKWLLMEGIFDSDEVSECNNIKNDEKILMYSGAITKHRGIPELLKAFEMIKDANVRLWLTGEGNSDELVRKYEQKDKRIHHFGFLDSREEVLRLQSQASILIHTREIDAPSSAYCFPSKLFEYMVSGKPIISVKIAGIPKEYYEYLIPIESLSPKSIYNAINEVSHYSNEDLYKKGEKARKFVVETKNETVQTKRILIFAGLIHE